MRWTRRRWGPWAIVGAGALLTGPLAFVFWIAAPEPGDRGINCGGIGFGETPCGWDAVGLLYALIGIPYALIVVAALGALELGGPRLHPVRLVLAAIAAVTPWLAAVGALLSS